MMNAHIVTCIKHTGTKENHECFLGSGGVGNIFLRMVLEDAFFSHLYIIGSITFPRPIHDIL